MILVVKMKTGMRTEKEEQSKKWNNNNNKYFIF